MKARITVTVQNRKQAKAIERGLERDDVRACVAIIGALDELPDDRALRRVLTSIADKADQQNGW